MKAMMDEEVPVTSAQHVANIGAKAVAAEAFEVRFGARSKTSVPINVAAAACGLPELVHKETGEKLGICASLAVAARTKGFFA